MRRFFRALALVCVAFGAMLGTACSTLDELGGGAGEASYSPRLAAVEAGRKIGPVLDDLTSMIALGGISDNVADDIAQFGPDVQAILAAYFDGAESCVVIGGQLVTETAVGRICSGSALNAIYDALDAQVWRWAIKAGIDTPEGQVIVAGRLVLNSVVRPTPGGPLLGYRDEPDVPLEDFMAFRARLKLQFETLIAAARNRARLTVAAPAVSG